jgi:hypothetical protein
MKLNNEWLFHLKYQYGMSRIVIYCIDACLRLLIICYLDFDTNYNKYKKINEDIKLSLSIFSAII